MSTGTTTTTITKQLGIPTRPAYKLEELLALRGSVSESTLSFEKFECEEAVKGEYLIRKFSSENESFS
jgi:hypothetical protein